MEEVSEDEEGEEEGGEDAEAEMMKAEQAKLEEEKQKLMANQGMIAEQKAQLLADMEKKANELGKRQKEHDALVNKIKVRIYYRDPNYRGIQLEEFLGDRIRSPNEKGITSFLPQEVGGTPPIWSTNVLFGYLTVPFVHSK